MQLTKYEQSGFILETKNGFRLALDIASKTPIQKLDGIQFVDAFLVSHIHGDHFSIPHMKQLLPKKIYLNHECVEAVGEDELSSEVTEIESGDTISIGEIKVSCFTVDHGPNVAPVKNLGFLLEVDNQVIYFCGDMFYTTGIDVSNLEVDYLLLPVGTFYTFGPQEAFSFAKQFKRVGKIIPMHYEKTPETRDQFLALAKNGFIVE